MQIKLYRTTSERNKLEKVLENELEVNGVLREETSILSPTFRIERGQGITNYNYVYIGAFGRYYYITDIVSVKNNLWEISCSVDPLMSWSEQIKQVIAISARNQFSSNVYIPDSDFAVDNRALFRYSKIGEFTDFEYYISVIGGYAE